jgi:hypothetical protein
VTVGVSLGEHTRSCQASGTYFVGCGGAYSGCRGCFVARCSRVTANLARLGPFLWSLGGVRISGFQTQKFWVALGKDGPACCNKIAEAEAAV